VPKDRNPRNPSIGEGQSFPGGLRREGCWVAEWAPSWRKRIHREEPNREGCGKPAPRDQIRSQKDEQSGALRRGIHRQSVHRWCGDYRHAQIGSGIRVSDSPWQ